MKKNHKTAVLMISPETGRLPKSMGPLARYISGKSGGLGEVVAALCAGLDQRGIACHLATLNLKKRFQRECQLDEESWQSIRHRLDPERIHLVSSATLSSLDGAYEGDPLHNAALFQRQIVNSLIDNMMAKRKGKLIIHSHDWMAGGIITAYA
ncbi:MAG: glycogen/starch synthase, partial [Syntrophales bacterium LBB04]|nr:glycogen/starch synthase [Syntrophales bacterium LBB04]